MTRLVLLAARVAPSPAACEEIRELARAGPDWVYVIRAALRHGVLPLVSRTLENLGAAPAELRRHYANHERRNAALTRELAALMEAFESRRIEAVAYKGPVLAAMAYGDIALRDFCDLDIVVRPAQVRPAAEALRALGYSPRKELDEACLRTGKDWQFFSESGSRVELHWAILPRRCHFRPDLEAARGRLARVEAGGFRFPSFSAVDTLLFLAAHGARHCWARLNWVCDIAELVRAHRMNWPEVYRAAQGSGAERLLSLALVLASELLGADLPEQAAADRKARALAAEVREAYFTSLESERPIARPEMFFARARERWRHRLAVRVPVMTQALRERAALSLSATRSASR